MRLTTTRDTALKNKATIALPRHVQKNTFLPFVLVFIIRLHSLSVKLLNFSLGNMQSLSNKQASNSTVFSAPTFYSHLATT